MTNSRASPQSCSLSWLLSPRPLSCRAHSSPEPQLGPLQPCGRRYWTYIRNADILLQHPNSMLPNMASYGQEFCQAYMHSAKYRTLLPISYVFSQFFRISIDYASEKTVRAMGRHDGHLFRVEGQLRCSGFRLRLTIFIILTDFGASF